MMDYMANMFRELQEKKENEMLDTNTIVVATTTQQEEDTDMTDTTIAPAPVLTFDELLDRKIAERVAAILATTSRLTGVVTRDEIADIVEEALPEGIMTASEFDLRDHFDPSDYDLITRDDFDPDDAITESRLDERLYDIESSVHSLESTVEDLNDSGFGEDERSELEAATASIRDIRASLDELVQAVQAIRNAINDFRVY